MSSRKHGTPPPSGRSDPITSDLQKFYEAIILLRVLEPSSLTRVAQSENLKLEKFLDRLSWMCDYEPGGLSVCAIAMEPTTSSTTFWFTTQSNFITRTNSNLGMLLAKLQTASALSVREAFDLEQSICADHITHAAKKVKNYTRKLLQLIKTIHNSNVVVDAVLWRDLERLVDVAGNPTELCSASHLFRDSESLRRINRKIEVRSISDEWSSLRHCIGRLGSWHRAANTVVEFAIKNPELFNAFKVEAVPEPRLTHTFHMDFNLLSVLKRMLPLERESELLQAVKALERLRETDIEEEFKEAARNLKPRIHAEVCLLDHFYEKNLSFVEAYRYIGCSKPSCHCCDLYFELHPGQFVRRRSHGNAWPNWSSRTQETIEIQGKRITILEAMTEVITQEVTAQMYGPSPKQPRVPDSTTGLSASLS